MTTTTRFIAISDALDEVTFDGDGLVPAIAQENGTGDVLMMAWMSKESLQRTLETGRMWYWNCHGDTLLFVVEQPGGAVCHTGEHTCFHRQLGTPA